MGSRRDKIRKFLLQEQEEDDELFFALVPALYSALYEEKRLVHTSSLTGPMKVKEILEGHETWSRVEFRMEPEIFRSISNYLLSIPHIDTTGDDVSPTNSSSSHLATLNPLSSNLDGGQSSTSEVPAAATGSSGPKEDGPVKKRKQSHVALVLEEYIDFKKKQTQVLVEELKEPKEADKYSIANCVAALELMEDLSVAEKSKALRLFKCQLNREIFLNTKDPILRSFWLKDEIADSMQRN